MYVQILQLNRYSYNAYIYVTVLSCRLTNIPTESYAHVLGMDAI